MKFNKLEIDSADRLIFGTAPYPVTTPRGLVIGGGRVYPELNFTLPTMFVDETTMPEVRPFNFHPASAYGLTPSFHWRQYGHLAYDQASFPHQGIRRQGVRSASGEP